MQFGDMLACCAHCGNVVVAQIVKDPGVDLGAQTARSFFKGESCRGCFGRTYRPLVGPLRVPRLAEEKPAP